MLCGMYRLAPWIAAWSCLWSCSSAPRSSAPPAPAAAPAAPAAPPAPVAPPPAADPLEPGTPIAREISAGEAHRYRFSLEARQVAVGAVMQNGIDLELLLFDPTGQKLAAIDSPNGTRGSEPFHIEATVAGAYDLVVRPFVEPASPSAPPPAPGASLALPAEGRYEVRLDGVMSAVEYGERRARDVIASPRLSAVWRAFYLRDETAMETFWRELAGKAPIVEPYPDDPRDVLVTFVMRSTSPYVGLIGGPTLREKPMLRLAGSDLWYLSSRMPAGSRIMYTFIVTDAPPAHRLPYRKDRGPDERWTRKQNDPNNPVVLFGNSRIELPGAPPQPWITAKPGVPRGSVNSIEIESAQLKETRRVGIYTPPGYDPKQRYPLLIAFDGEAYGLEPSATVPLPTILDNMIAAKQIPPIVAALVASQGKRSRDLPGSALFSAFIAKELVPKLRASHRAGLSPAETIVAGSSFGGLCSAYTAFHHPDVIGNVLSQSGSFQYVQGAITSDVPETAEGGWLIRDYAAAPKQPLRLYLEAGLFEGDLLASNRHMRDVLIAKGYPLTYVEFSGSHDYGVWRGTISDGLIALLPKRR